MDADSGLQTNEKTNIPDTHLNSLLNSSGYDRPARKSLNLDSFEDQNVLISLFLRSNAEKIIDFLQKKEKKVTSLAVTEERLFVGDEAGHLDAYDLEHGAVAWNVKVGGKISGIRIYKSGVLISSLDNFLYYYSNKSGRLIWKKRIDGRIYDLPQKMNRHIAVSGFGNNFAEIIDLENGKVVNRLNLREDSNIVGEILPMDDFYVVRTNNSIVVFGFGGCATE